MPKINSKVFTKTQQQSLRRMKERTTAFESQFAENKIECVSLNKLYTATNAELTALLPIIKKMIQHNDKVNKLITERCFKPDEIKSDEYNIKLYDYLMIQYKGVKGQNLKYNNCHRKDKFRESVLLDNQLEFNNMISIENENTIKKLFNDIDIDSYEPSTRALEKTQKEITEKRAVHIEAVEQEIIIPDAPEITTPKSIPTPVKKPKRVRRTKAEMLEARKPKPEIPQVIELIVEDVAEYSDSDIEEDIKKLELRDNNDQDNNTDYDIQQWRSKINRLWKSDIEDDFSLIFDDDDDDTRFNKIIETYVNRTKRQVRGRNEKIGYWANRNPISLKKIITSIIKSINNKINKETEC